MDRFDDMRARIISGGETGGESGGDGSSYLMMGENADISSSSSLVLGAERAGKTYARKSISSFLFTTKDNVPMFAVVDSWDVSEANDESVMAYILQGAGNDLIIASDGRIALPSNCKHLFAAYSMACNMFLMQHLDASTATNMASMFQGTGALNIIINGWDTSNVIDMNNMFYSSSIKVIDAGNLNVSNVTNMQKMFYYATTLTRLNISNWNGGGVPKNMDEMFSYLNALTTLDLSSWENMSASSTVKMFYSTPLLTALDLSKLDVSNTTDMNNMFYGCGSLTTIGDVSNWDTSNVTDMKYMFYNCGVTSLDLSGWDVSSVNNMNYIFYGCSKLATLTGLKDWNISAIPSAYNLTQPFNGCSSLTELDLSNWNVSKINNMASFFANCSSLTKLDLSGWTTGQVTNMNSMFSGCSSLQTLDIRNMSFTGVASASASRYMFNGIPADCTIYVKDAAAQTYVLGRRSDFTNVVIAS